MPFAGLGNLKCEGISGQVSPDSNSQGGHTVLLEVRGYNHDLCASRNTEGANNSAGFPPFWGWKEGDLSPEQSLKKYSCWETRGRTSLAKTRTWRQEGKWLARTRSWRLWKRESQGTGHGDHRTPACSGSAPRPQGTTEGKVFNPPNNPMTLALLLSPNA